MSRNGAAKIVEEILRGVKKNHPTSREYTFETEALELYKEFYGEVKEQLDIKNIFTEAVQRSILSKMQVSARFIPYIYRCNLFPF